jgi:hypothetical protein
MYRAGNPSGCRRTRRLPTGKTQVPVFNVALSVISRKNADELPLSFCL